MLRFTQPPCSKCHAEPRAPGQRWGRRCFARYHRDRRARLRRERDEGCTRDTTTMHNIPRAYNTPPPLFEQRKRVVLEIPKFPNRPKTIRVSVFPLHGHEYVDVRIYLADKPTRKGVTIHRDLLPAVLEGLQRAQRTAWEQWPAPGTGAPLPGRESTSLHWPEDW